MSFRRLNLFLISSLLGVSVFAAPVNSAFNGFYVGLGNTYNSVENKTDLALDQYVGMLDPTASHTRVAEQSQSTLNIGYGFQLSKDFYLGVNAYYNAGQLNVGQQDFNVLSSPTIPNNTYFTTAFNTKLTSSYGVALQPGMLLNSSNLIYLNIGFNQATFKNSSYSYLYQEMEPGIAFKVDPLSASKENTASGTTIGLGYQYKISKRFSLYAEYNLVAYSQYKWVHDNNDDTLETNREETYKVTTNINQFAWGLRYHF
jgi:opacity protein-like surface antigen